MPKEFPGHVREATGSEQGALRGILEVESGQADEISASVESSR